MQALTMSGSILTLNAGSSSLKFALFDTDGQGGSAILRGAVESLSQAPRLRVRDGAGAVLEDRVWPEIARPTLTLILEAILKLAAERAGPGGLTAVGHRVVQGGPDHSAPEPVTPALLAALEAATVLDPLHMPDSLAAMRAVAADRPGLAQVACFDTAFHQTLAPVATRLALPRAVSDQGVRRYGFHGLSYEYIALCLRRQWPSLAEGRVLAAHLGSGASLCALRNGRSVETTTGFSALDGLVMATRCGRLDPGVVLHLAREGKSWGEIEDMLYHRSGLLGVSGISGDVRVLTGSADSRAREAIDLFVYRIVIEAGGMVSALGGLDTLVFTAGVGEHAPTIRAAICERLAWLGVRLDGSANARDAACISARDSAVQVLVIAADEEAMIARHTQTTLQPA